MKLSTYFNVRGRQRGLARAIPVPASLLSAWASGVRAVPIERCIPIELATGGAVTRRDLRPDDWHLIWPELVDSDGAPEDIPLNKEEA